MTIHRFQRQFFLAAVFLAGLAVLVPPLSTHCEEPARPSESAAPPLVERVASELVLIEVYATDAKGRPVLDLTREDFVLRIDGRNAPRKITSFESFQTGAPAGWSAPDPAAAGERSPQESGSAPGETVPAGPPRLPQRVILFFEDATSQPERVGGARLAVDRFLERLPPSTDQFAIASFEDGRGLRILHDFSSDRASLHAALLASHKDPRRFSNLEALRLDPERPPPWSVEKVDIELSIREEQHHLRRVMRAMAALNEILAGWPGRRSLIFIGDGLPLYASARFGVAAPEYSLMLEAEEVSESAVAANVTVSAVQTLGLRASGQFGSASRGAALNTLALDTGGTSRIGNDPFRLLQGIEEGSRSYYLLGYAPEGPPDGRSHSIAVAVSRPGVSLRHRLSFIRFTPEVARGRAIQAAFLAPELYAGMRVDLTAIGGPSAEGRQSVDLVIYIPSGSFLALPRPGGRTALLEVGFVALDGEGTEVARLARRVQVALPKPSTRAGDDPDPPTALNLLTHLVLPPVALRVTTVVSDLHGGTLGASRFDLEPPPKDGRTAEGLSIYSRNENSLWIEVSGETPAGGPPLQSEPPRLAPALRSRFAPDEEIACTFRVASQGGARATTHLQAEIVRQGTALRRVPARLWSSTKTPETGGAAAPANRSWGANPSLAGLAAGDYRLVIREIGAAGDPELGGLAFRIAP